MRRPLAALVVTGLLTGCASGWERTSRNGARVIVEGVNVDWAVSRELGKAGDGTDHALFAFSRTYDKKTSPAYLSIEQRAAYAHRVVNGHPRCSWAGFSPVDNRLLAPKVGATQDVIVAQVRC